MPGRKAEVNVDVFTGDTHNKDAAKSISGSVEMAKEDDKSESGAATPDEDREPSPETSRHHPTGSRSPIKTPLEGTSSNEDGHWEQSRDWFLRGKYFSVKTENTEDPLHEQRVLLMNSMNEYGMAVRVDVLAADKDIRQLAAQIGTQDKTLVLRCCEKTPADKSHEKKREAYISERKIKDSLRKLEEHKLRQIHLETEPGHHCVEPASIVRLTAVHNIPFHSKNRYKDLGKLEHPSLENLRFAFLRYLGRNLLLDAKANEHDWTSNDWTQFVVKK